MGELFRVRNFAYCATMQLDHFQHRRDVVRSDWFRYAAGARVVIAWERSNCLRQARALLVRFASHDRGDRAAKCSAFDTVVAETVTHDERAEIRVAESERAKNM